MSFASSHAGTRSSLRAFSLSPLALACLLALPQAVRAQAAAPNAPTLSPVIITANPLGNESPATPSSVLEGDELTLRQKGSLGETLNGLPGVSSTYFGPGASRPVIRGMDGDRIRLLRNGVGALDASSLSYDHAVPEDPNSVERLEVVRGPAALLYGGNAIGGVVNSFDNRIPSEPVDGIHGNGELRYGGADTHPQRCRRSGSKAGDGNFALHVDAASREFNDVRIPGYAHSSRQRQIDGDTGKHRVQNSDGRQDGGAVGGSYHWEHGYAGLSYSGYDSNYGSPAEDDVRLKMQQDRYAFASEIRDLEGPFTSLKLDAAYTEYQHKEIEDGETGTTFKNEGYEGRIEARHRPLGPLNGVVGAQFANSRFSALGEEAFVPHTETDSAALFALEEWKLSDRLDLSFGARLEHTRVDPDAKGNERFAENDGSQSFTTGSLSTGAVYKLTPIWSLAATLAYTERAPTFYELYANGPHAATGTYEVGDADADKEKAVSTDLALRFDNGVHKGSVGVFYSRFSNYIGLLASGRHRNEEGEVVAAGDDEALPEYLYSGVRADFYGVEAESSTRVLQSGGHKLDLGLSGDYTVARNSDTGRSLPRIPPLRLRVALDYGYGPYSAGVSVSKAFAQHSRPDNDTATAGYYSLDANAGYRFKVAAVQWQAYVRGINLTNQDIRYATSVLRDVAPEGGRAVMVGLRGSF